MLEVEVKFAVADAAALEARLFDWTRLPVRRDEDYYFSAPDRDFATTDEALRVRTVGEKNYLTYKGPRRDAETKSRLELELPLADGTAAGQEARDILVHLGYRFAGVVGKSRTIFETRRGGTAITATIDDVDELGCYAEIEVVADEADYAHAKALVLAVAAELGLEHAERRSYLQLLLSKQAGGKGLVRVVKTVPELHAAATSARAQGRSVGLVPTMGALHAGHAALIERARAECGFVVVTIFVNPTQFGPAEDFSRYPRTPDADVSLCASLGVDLVFAPDTGEVYREGFGAFVEVSGLTDALEGEFRPGHFRGVATVVLKLLNMAQPDVAYFGQKDAQQVAVVQKMVCDLDVPVRVTVVPTVRESDGLALSSRNRYLDPTLRQQAVVLSQALYAVRSAVDGGERDGATLRRLMADVIGQAPDARVDYATVVDPQSFSPLVKLEGPAIAVLAVRFGATRLIDNMWVNDGK